MAIRIIALLICLGIPLAAQQASRFELPAEQRTGLIRRIFVLCHSHLDIGFTRPPDEVARDYKENIDAAIRLTRANPDFKWTIETAWMLEEWLRRTEDPALVGELGAMLRDGRMGLGLAFANMHSGLMAAEETNRLNYLGHKFRKQWGLKADIALQNDVPGFTWAYPRVFAGSGVKRLITGLNLFIGGGNNLGVSQNPFYWVGPDGSRVLTYFTYDSYVEGYRWNLAQRFSLADLEKSVPRRLAWLEKNGYKYDTYLLMASPGDNISPVAAYPILERMRQWNKKHPELPMEMVTPNQFFDYLIGKYGDNFPEASGDAAGHWELVKLRVPEAAAKMRQASSVLPAAETAAAVASLLTKRSYPRFDLSEAWYSLLAFHEHTADSGGGWPGYFSRWEADWSNTAHYSAALNGFSGAEQILRRSILRLVLPGEEHSLMSPVSSSRESAAVVIYNGLSWRRGGPVVVDRLPPALRDGPVAVRDAVTGGGVPHEMVPGTKRQLLIFAQDVPAVGYKVYRIEKGEASPPAASAPFPLKVSWNSAGWITSVRDERSGRELVPAESAQGIGRIFVSLGKEDFRPDDTGPARVHVEDGPVTRRIEMVRDGSVLPRTVVTLYRDAPYVDLRFDVDLGILEAVTAGNTRYAISLPFRAEKTFVDGAGFVARIPEDILPGGRAPQFTPVHFVHYRRESGWGATVANIDAAIVRPDQLFLLAADSLRSQTRDEGLVRLFRTEPRTSPVQSFRFRVAIQDENTVDWKRLGAEANLPLRAVVATGTPSAAERGFFEVSDPRIHLLAFKPAEHQPGWHVLRLQESSGENVNAVKLDSPLKMAEPTAANLVEEPLGTSLDLQNLSFRPWETKTILVRAAGGND
jgi:hypothetical protein